MEDAAGKESVEMTIIAYFHRFTVMILKTLADVVDAADDDAVDVDAGSITDHAPSETPSASSSSSSSSAAVKNITGAPGQEVNHTGNASKGNTSKNHTNNGNQENGAEGKDDDDLEGESEVIIESEDMARMGLDVWSESDRDFVVGLVGFYWGRRASVRGGRWDVCGVRLC